MDDIRYEKYLIAPEPEQSYFKKRIEKLAHDWGCKLGLRQLKPRVLLVGVGILSVLIAFGLWRSGLFRATEQGGAGQQTELVAEDSTGDSAHMPVGEKPVAATETTVTVHVVLDQEEQGTKNSQDAATRDGSTDALDSEPQSSDSTARIDINSADAAALDTLPGVGPATAEKIITDRTTNGRFTNAQDLMRVSGIGEKKFDALKDLIVAR